MLQFLYGRAATGKTYTVFEKIMQDAKQGKDVVLLVPEQFTFESERTLLHTLGDKASTDVSVLSFTRLYDEITRYTGGRVAEPISEFDRVVLMGQAFSAVRDKVNNWAKYIGSSRFTQSLVNIVTELKTCAVSAEDLMNTAEKTNSAYLKNKLENISAIYMAYNSLLQDRFLDPMDNLSRLYDKLLDFPYFKGKTVYVDAFKNFTGQQYKILERIIKDADNVYFSVTSADINNTDIGVFYNVNATVRKIIRIAEKFKVPVCEPVQFNTPHYISREMFAAEAALSGDSTVTYCEETKDITVCKCNSVYDEAAFVGRTIRRLVRENGYRYRDFVIICRTAEKYQDIVERECERNNVFFFADKRKPITDLPLTVMIDCALKLTSSFNCENIFTFLKTGLGTLSTEEIAELENYSYLWRIPGKMWNEEWTMNPSGFVPENSEKQKEQLKHINDLRKRAIEPILFLRSRFHGTPADMASAVMQLLDKCSTAEILRERAQWNAENGFLQQADEIRQNWDIITEVLNGIVKCLPEKETAPAEFVRIWQLAVSFATIGNIPQMLDEVTFGAADRIRPSRPKIAFVMGANQGEFPKSVVNTGIFSSSDREELISLGVEIRDTSLTAAVDEDYLAYTSLCCPAEKLFVTYAVCDSAGKQLEPSSFVKTLRETFVGLKQVCEPSNFKASLPESEKTAFTDLCRYHNSDKSAAKTLELALNTNLDAFILRRDKTTASLTAETASELYGNKIPLSATKFDTFHKCKFSFFCKYGLRAKKIQPADFDVLQRGTIVHFVLEELVSRNKNNIAALTREQTDDLVDSLIAEYLAKIPGFDRMQTARTRFVVNKIAVATKDVAFHIVKEFAQSEFVPEYCELKIENAGVISPLEIPFSKKGSMVFGGSIDRVDAWNGYVRVVDYKTGTRNFKLPDILVGLNLQMLLYLFLIVRGGGEVFPQAKPAGVLYMPSKRELDEVGLTMNGIILHNDEVAAAMEAENAGEFIPKLYINKDGSLSKKSPSYVSEEMFENIFDYIEKSMQNMGREIISGCAQAQPVDGCDTDACKYCDYYAVCCIEDFQHRKAERLSNSDVLIKLKEMRENGI